MENNALIYYACLSILQLLWLGSDHSLLELSLEIDDLTDLGLKLWEGLGLSLLSVVMAVTVIEDIIFCIPCMVCTILCIRVLIEDISNSDCSALASKAAIFDLANYSSACATSTVALLSTHPLGGVWLRSGDAGLISAACLCLYLASISSIVGTIVWFISAASITSLNTVARLAGWGAATD